MNTHNIRFNGETEKNYPRILIKYSSLTKSYGLANVLIFLILQRTLKVVAYRKPYRLKISVTISTVELQ